MAYDLAYMRQLVRNRLDDDDFETEFLDQAINEAQWEIFRNKNLILKEKRTVDTLLAGASEIDYPTDIETLVAVRLTNNAGDTWDITEYFMDYADYELWLNNLAIAPVSVPLRWTTFGTKMLFQNKADQDYLVTFTYLKKIPKLVLETDVPSVPEDYQEMLKIGAYMRIAAREDDYDVKAQEKRDFDTLNQDFIREYTRNRGPKRKRIMRMGR